MGMKSKSEEKPKQADHTPLTCAWRASGDPATATSW